MARSSSRSGSAAFPDLGEMARLLHDLSGPLAQLAAYVSANARQASSSVPERISETFTGIRASVRDGTRAAGEEAARVGKNAWERVEDGVVHRPLVALAIAAGIGFLLGALNRR